MILDIDWGNTRIKWRIQNSTESEAQTYAVELAQEDTIASIPVALRAIKTHKLFQQGKKPIRIRVVSVRSKAANAALADQLQDCFSVKAEFARTAKKTAGIVNHYQNPEQMGVDRWSAVVAAVKRLADGRACCVVDAGSAMTIDCVNAAAQHFGGFILPGVAMQIGALYGGTDSIASAHEEPVDAIDLDRLFPDNTRDAVEQGVLLNLSSAVAMAAAMLQRECSSSSNSHKLAVILTGGDARRLESYWQTTEMLYGDFDVTISDSLVLDGLNYLLT